LYMSQQIPKVVFWYTKFDERFFNIKNSINSPNYFINWIYCFYCYVKVFLSK